MYPLHQFVLVSFYVFSTIDVRLKRFMTIWTHKWPFVAMCDQMSLHAALCGEFCIAY